MTDVEATERADAKTVEKIFSLFCRGWRRRHTTSRISRVRSAPGDAPADDDSGGGAAALYVGPAAGCGLAVIAQEAVAKSSQTVIGNDCSDGWCTAISAAYLRYLLCPRILPRKIIGARFPKPTSFGSCTSAASQLSDRISVVRMTPRKQLRRSH